MIRFFLYQFIIVHLLHIFPSLNSDLAVSSGAIDLTGAALTAGTMRYQNVGKKANLSFADLQLANSFQSGTAITIFTLDSASRPLDITKSVLVCQNVPLYLTVATTGEIIIANYSGITLETSSIIEGQVSYVIA